jgi:hypothetical protein
MDPLIADVAQGLMTLGLWIIAGAFWCRSPSSNESRTHDRR